MKRGAEKSKINHQDCYQSNKRILEIKKQFDFSRLPKDVLKECIIPKLAGKDLICFALACKVTYKLAKPDLIPIWLLNAVARGNQNKAKELIAKNPLLLLNNKAESTDYSGKSIKHLTPFQAALCAGDIEMCKMMRPYFAQLDNGQHAFKSQMEQIFPNGVEDDYEDLYRARFDFSEVMSAILTAPIHEVKLALEKQFDTNLPLHRILNHFRKDFREKSQKEIIFNPFHYFNVILAYDQVFHNADCWERLDLMTRQVVGWTQRFFSACWGQALAQGIHYIAKKNEPLKRQFKCRTGKGLTFPLQEMVGLGFDYAICSHGTRKTGHVHVTRRSSPFSNRDRFRWLWITKRYELSLMLEDGIKPKKTRMSCPF